MNKYQKIFSFSTISILFLAFLFSFIGLMIGIEDLAYVLKNAPQVWSLPVGWFIELGVTIFTFIILIVGAIKVYKDKITCLKTIRYLEFIFFMFMVEIFVNNLLACINAAVMHLDFNVAAFIVVTIGFIASIVLNVLGRYLKTSTINKRVLNIISYVMLFVFIIVTAAISDLSGFAVAFYVFFIFGLIALGVFSSIYEMDFEKAKAKISEKIFEEEKEEKSTLETKLNELNALKEKGVITEEEYNEKRKDIIEKY